MFFKSFSYHFHPFLLFGVVCAIWSFWSPSHALPQSWDSRCQKRHFKRSSIRNSFLLDVTRCLPHSMWRCPIDGGTPPIPPGQALGWLHRLGTLQVWCEGWRKAGFAGQINKEIMVITSNLYNITMSYDVLRCLTMSYDVLRCIAIYLPAFTRHVHICCRSYLIHLWESQRKNTLVAGVTGPSCLHMNMNLAKVEEHMITCERFCDQFGFSLCSCPFCNWTQ